MDYRFDCFADRAEGARPLFAVRPAGLDALLASFPQPCASFVRSSGFTADAQQLTLLPGPDGVAGAILGLGEDHSPYAWGELAFRLPDGSPWRIEGDHDLHAAVLGYCLGAYRYKEFISPKRPAARLILPEEQKSAVASAAAICMVRDLINTPANLLGPAELADAAMELAHRYSAQAARVDGAAVRDAYPAIAAVGQGSVRPPAVIVFRWQGSAAGPGAPLVSLCGKGVCFDTGGYDLKPSAAMLKMKKDMGGAANALGLARLIMEADLPVRLAVRVGCVENSVSGTAMRPMDVIRTRKGLSVEIGNTDAEGRLVLCDLLAEAAEEAPDLLIDFATLTGAARVALGPDIPAMFCNRDALADIVCAEGHRVHDPLWRLPIWAGYDPWLNSTIADLNNVSGKPFAGAIVGALFLSRFVPPAVPWIHIDLYAWNDQARPGRPEGGEAQAIRAIFAALVSDVITASANQNRRVT